jgi:gas vesicle protein
LAGNIADDAADLAEAVINKGKDLAEDTAETVVRVGGELFDKGKDLVEDTAETVVRVGGEIIDKGVDLATDFAESAKDRVEDIGEAAGRVGEKLADAGSKIGEAIIDVAETLFEEASDVAASAAETTAEQALTAGSSAIDKTIVADPRTEKIREAAEELKSRYDEKDDKFELPEELPPSFAEKLGIKLDDASVSVQGLEKAFGQPQPQPIFEPPHLAKGAEFGGGFTDPPRDPDAITSAHVEADLHAPLHKGFDHLDAVQVHFDAHHG